MDSLGDSDGTVIWPEVAKYLRGYRDSFGKSTTDPTCDPDDNLNGDGGVSILDWPQIAEAINALPDELRYAFNAFLAVDTADGTQDYNVSAAGLVQAVQGYLSAFGPQGTFNALYDFNKDDAVTILDWPFLATVINSLSVTY